LGVVTQARSESAQRVTSYTVQVSSDGKYFEYVDGGVTFQANRPGDDDDFKVKNFFANSVETRFVKIVVKSWSTYISMRAAVLVPKAAPTPKPAPTPAPTSDVKCVLRQEVTLHKRKNMDPGLDPVATCESHCRGFPYFGLLCPGQHLGIYCTCQYRSEYNNASQLPKYHCLGECQPSNTSDCPGYKGDGVAVDQNCPGVLIKGQRYRHWNGYALGASWRIAYYPMPPVTPAPTTPLVQGSV